jgi:diadenosine tetraphosphate (Ap4A) HIT family hydrolase
MATPTTNCVFCTNNIQGEAVVNNQLLFSTDHWNVLLDHKPVTHGHLILTPKTHRFVQKDLTEQEHTDLFKVQQKIHQAYENALGFSHNIQYEKNGIGQGVPHFQIHVLPVSSSWDLAWLQAKLLCRMIPWPIEPLSDEILSDLKSEFQPPEAPKKD